MWVMPLATKAMLRDCLPEGGTSSHQQLPSWLSPSLSRYASNVHPSGFDGWHLVIYTAFDGGYERTFEGIRNHTIVLHSKGHLWIQAIFIAGVIGRVSERAKCRFLKVFPRPTFDAFIVFQAHKHLLRRREDFPSYSWTGWKGGANVEGRDHRAFGNLIKWLEKDTWIIEGAYCRGRIGTYW